MNDSRPERVIRIDGGEARPVGAQSSMDAAIAGLEHAQGRVEVGQAARTTPREARALDLQTNGFAQHERIFGVDRDLGGIIVTWNTVTYEGKSYPSIVYTSPTGNRARYRVTAEQWHDRPGELLDAPVWLYLPDAAEDGTDPWRLGDGLEKWPARSDLPDAYELWLASGRSIRGLGASFPLYLQEEHFRLLHAARG